MTNREYIKWYKNKLYQAKAKAKQNVYNYILTEYGIGTWERWTGDYLDHLINIEYIIICKSIKKHVKNNKKTMDYPNGESNE